jgi:hypothetical protein
VVSRGDRSAQQVFEEAVEDGSLSLMGEDHIAILVFKVFDLILPKTARGAKVEVPGVFVPKDAVFDFCPLPPVRCFVRVLLAEVGFCKGTEAPFENKEVAMFFQAVEEGDDRTAIEKVDRRKLEIPSPNPSRRADPLEPETESANRGEVGVRGPDAVPVCVRQVGKGGVSKPRVFHANFFCYGGPWRRQ